MKKLKESKLKESQLYKQFFYKNLFLLLLPTVACAISGFIYYLHQPITYLSNVLLEMKYSEHDVKDKLLIVDESVVLSRSAQIQGRILTSGKTDISVYKAGPLLVSVDVSGYERSNVVNDTVKVANFLKDNYPYTQIGEIVEYESVKPFYIFIIVGAVAGFLFGLFISLVKTYFLTY